MKIEILPLPKETPNRDDKVAFRLSGVHTSFANALRRIILGEIPILALDEVNILENPPSYNVEYLTHRIELIPISQTTKLDQEFKLDVSGKSWEGELIQSKEITPSNLVYPDAEIIRLRGGETLKFTARPALFSPRSKRRENADEEKGANFECVNVMALKQEAEDTYWLQIESTYHPFFPPMIILKKGLEVLIEKLEFLNKKLSQTQTTKIDIRQNPASEIVDIIIYEEGDTLANLLSNYLRINYYPRDISFVAYNKAHPLIDEVVIKIKTGSLEHAKDLLAKTISKLVEDTKKLLGNIPNKS